MPKKRTRKSLTPKQRSIVAGVVERWAATVSGATPPDLKMAETCMRAAYSDETRDKIKVIFVRSPQMFYILQGISRGQISKKIAREMAARYGLQDTHLIEEVRRSPMRKVYREERWSYWSAASPIGTAWETFGGEAVTAERHKRADAFNINIVEEEDPEAEAASPAAALAANDARWGTRNQHRAKSEIMAVLHNECRRASSLFDARGVGPAEQQNAIFKAGYTNPASNAMRTRLNVLSRTINTDSDYHPSYYASDMIDREAFCKLMGINDLSVTWEHEIFHYVTAFMTFRDHALIMASRPVICVDSEHTLTSETGPTIEWPDGAKSWHRDGHNLGTIGEKIVMRPDDLTAEDFAVQNNQEVRRIMLDIMGWDKYLNGAGAYVLDKRENDVDNTVELLIVVPEKPSDAPKTMTEALEIKDRRMVLACRSTGRKYCLGVNETATTCEEAQNWLSGGFLMPKNSKISSSVPSLPMRVIGAS